jgi:hypothetical protein
VIGTDAIFVLLVLAGALLAWMIGMVLRSGGRRRISVEFDGFRPGNVFVALTCILVGSHSLYLNFPIDISVSSLIGWGPALLGGFVLLCGVLMMVVMLRNHVRKTGARQKQNMPR